jgi:hypothetical protein
MAILIIAKRKKIWCFKQQPGDGFDAQDNSGLYEAPPINVPDE